MRYIDRLLARDERIALITRSHWSVLLPVIAVNLALAVVIIALSVAGGLVAPPLPWFGLLLLLVPLVHSLISWWVWHSRVIVVTNRRIIQVSGVFTKRISDTLLEKVNDIVTRQTTLGRLFNYGDIELISGSESGTDVFRRIADPNSFKKSLLEHRGSAGEVASAGSPGKETEADIPALIRQLAELHEKGILSDAEFEQKKAELLRRL